MPPISVLVKPSSGNCNLECQYCFYRDISEGREQSSRGFMSLETARMLLEQIFRAAEGQVTIAFQGGEPTLVGLEFYRAFVELEKALNLHKIPVQYAIQTNGTLLNEDWAQFFREHKFLVGVSLDGTAEIHNTLRNPNGRGSYTKVTNAIRMLERQGVEYNILTVVTAAVARHYEKIYRQYRKNGYQYLQFIPCLDGFGADAREYSLTPELYGKFLVGMYGLWRVDMENGKPISIRLFDNLAARLSGKRTEMCGWNGFCSIQFVIEADGTVYPCDFYCTDEFEMGNIRETGFKALYEGEAAQRFLASSQKGAEKCKSCLYFALCRGGCRRERESDAGLAKNRFCQSYQELFKEFL